MPSTIETKFAPNLYIDPPLNGLINIDEAEDLFRQRLEAMAILSNYKEATADVPLSSLLRAIKSQAFAFNCVSLLPTGEQRKLDNISHFLTRLYFALHPNLWDSYKHFERRLLNYRLKEIDCFSAEKLAAFLDCFDFKYELLSQNEVAELTKQRYLFWYSWSSGLASSTKTQPAIFKVKFEHAIQFVAKRTVSIKDGYALLTSKEIVSVICDAFEQHLDRSLRLAGQTLFMNEKVKHLYSDLDLVYQEFQETEMEKKRLLNSCRMSDKTPFSINILDIDNIVRNHYPPCMRHLHESLRQDHHLRHHGRLYLGAFMRQAGVTEQEAIEFWRNEFTKKIPNDKFERDYKYNIRHLYGKEGHRKALSSFSCDKIINSNAPGPADQHGCPFKHFDEAHLVTMLKKHEIKEYDIETIKLAKEQKDHTRACCEYFKAGKEFMPYEPIRNPVQYYYQSRRLAHDKIQKSAEIKEENIETNPMSEPDNQINMIDSSEQQQVDQLTN